MVICLNMTNDIVIKNKISSIILNTFNYIFSSYKILKKYLIICYINFFFIFNNFIKITTVYYYIVFICNIQIIIIFFKI